MSVAAIIVGFWMNRLNDTKVGREDQYLQIEVKTNAVKTNMSESKTAGL
jgi:hypothetical protein